MHLQRKLTFPVDMMPFGVSKQAEPTCDKFAQEQRGRRHGCEHSFPALWSH